MAKKIKTYYLSTYDNPYDPAEQFDEWYNFDKRHHYNCCEILADLAYTSDQLTAEENEDEKRRAILGLISADPFNIYCMITKEEDEANRIVQPNETELT